MDGFQEFEFDLPRVLKEELITLIDSMSDGKLDVESTRHLPDVQGVYQLFYEGKLVYIGKTDADAGLRVRLSRHAKKILHRPSLTGVVRFKAVRILVFTAMDLETELIKHYRGQGSGAVPWNGSGFGSNDPGRRRETTNQALDGFDVSFPIDIDLPGSYLEPGITQVSDALKKLKSALPYNLRYETQTDEHGRALRGHPHPDLIATNVTIHPGSQTVRSLLKIITDSLGTDWQATQFASHVILYKERTNYAHGSVI